MSTTSDFIFESYEAAREAFENAKALESSLLTPTQRGTQEKLSQLLPRLGAAVAYLNKLKNIRKSLDELKQILDLNPVLFASYRDSEHEANLQSVETLTSQQEKTILTNAEPLAGQIVLYTLDLLAYVTANSKIPPELDQSR